MENNQTEEGASNRAPRQIAIEILGDDTPKSSMKILSMPSTSTVSSKVVDFRQITMKSDFNQAILGGAGKEDKLRAEGGRVVSKDMMLHAKEMFNFKKDGQLLRPLLPKPVQRGAEAGGGQLLVTEAGGPLRIKQVTRIDTPSDKPPELHVVTPSTSKTSMTSSAGSNRGRRKYSKRSYYAYVTESESEGEGGEVRKKKKTPKRREDEEVVSGRRSKRASMSQKLAQWGLLPSGKEEGEEELDDVGEGEEEMMLGVMKASADIKSEDDLDKEVKLEEEEEEEDEEEEEEPLIAAPLPKFINVPLSEQSTPTTPVQPVHTQAPRIEVPVASTVITSDKTTTAAPTPTKVTTAVTMPVEKEIKSVFELEELLSGIEKSKAVNKVPITELPKLASAQPSPLYLPKAVPVAPVARTVFNTPTHQAKAPSQVPQAVTSTGTQSSAHTGVLKTITPSGWLKKASNMLQHNRSTPAYKRMDTMNKSLMCKPIMLTKGTTFNPLRIHKSTQTDEEEVLEKKSMVVPVPVPFYIPAPTTPCLLPTTHPLPIALPLPLPCPLPSSRASVAALIKQVEDQLSKVKQETGMAAEEEDLLQIAELISCTKTEQDKQLEEYNASIIRGVNDSDYVYPGTLPARERSGKQAHWLTRSASMPDEGKNFMGVANVPSYMDSSRSEEALESPVEGSRFSKGSNQPLPLNDDCMKLKYSYAMQAWRYWTEVRNSENAKRMNMLKGRVQFFFQSDPLKSSPEQLAGSLAYFVRDVKKLDGSKFAPDSIYFLCLGIQYYLRENGRDDSIFFDVVYQKFTDALNDVLASFEMKINSQNMLICRVTEEHLWEAGQLGCHSPHTLLASLIYFNTKHFLLTSVDHHLRLSASSFQLLTQTRGERQVKKLVFKHADGEESEVNENSEDPLKCPVLLHQFYLSKCAGTQRSFYCLPEPPSKGDGLVWFSQNPLSKGALTKILNRCLVVREVQVANLQQMQVEG